MLGNLFNRLENQLNGGFKTKGIFDRESSES